MNGKKKDVAIKIKSTWNVYFLLFLLFNTFHIVADHEYKGFMLSHLTSALTTGIFHAINCSLDISCHVSLQVFCHMFYFYISKATPI